MCVPPAEALSALRTSWRRRGCHVRVPPTEARSAHRTRWRRRCGHVCVPRHCRPGGRQMRAALSALGGGAEAGTRVCCPAARRRAPRSLHMVAETRRTRACAAHRSAQRSPHIKRRRCSPHIKKEKHVYASCRSAPRSPHMVAKTRRTDACAASSSAALSAHGGGDEADTSVCPARRSAQSSW